MNKTTTHKDSLDVRADLLLEDRELDSVSGGAIKGAREGVCQNDPAHQLFQKALQQVTQGQG